jgi:hypothetical protein
VFTFVATHLDGRPSGGWRLASTLRCPPSAAVAGLEIYEILALPPDGTLEPAPSACCPLTGRPSHGCSIYNAFMALQDS